ncbi:heparin lyase I family protein [Sphingobacterium paludis]|uniref:Polysaccharide lyase-like protein n=1 Tax=Sphingobacterium paludis TaxID=1476465 RepID=A0A4R7CUK8_9SPHI|nr:heparin lyase I family protein [Sphingobacterium paludis]TDS11820.1 polysaccharide lyase-like protein [Sphingobacterium paludis]
MKKNQPLMFALEACFLAVLLLSCKQTSTFNFPNQTEPSTLKGVTAGLIAGSVSDTILQIDYETQEENGGFAWINPTNAPATDAASIASPGRSGNYAIAHKVVLGDPGYFSNEAYRSESDAINMPAALFFPGDKRRYEFSVNLVEWELWNPANTPYGDNIFQLKVSGGDPVPIRFLTKRHAIVARYGAKGQATIVPDFRQHINKWIDFRIDVLWGDQGDGWMKVYTRLPGQSTYTLQFENLNATTFTGVQLDKGQKGYIKWGVYREAGKDSAGHVITTDNILRRTALHDDIRIIKLP